MPPKIANQLERELRISIDKIKQTNGENLEQATVQIVTSTPHKIIDVVIGDKNFDEASCEIVSQSKSVVKNVVIKKVGRNFLKVAILRQMRWVSAT